MSEFERIARLRALFEQPSADVQLGIGDDCAVLAPSAHPRVWTVDAAVAGVHFDLAFMAPGDVGYRAFMSAASDLAAMGARAVAALSSLVLPEAIGDRELDALAGGLARAAEACRCPIVGGNLARGHELSVTTSLLGECGARVVTRTGARPGELVYVSGPLGGAALGLALLSRGVQQPDAAACAAFLAPRARLDVAALLAAHASAAIDVSDGLHADLHHLCEASGVGARLELARIPTLPGFAALARQLGLDPLALIAGGGDDYELLFTAPAGVPAELGVAIGEVTREPEIVLLDAAGAPFAPGRAGFDHFR
jgi:thiamine-monophosphate kinase